MLYETQFLIALLLTVTIETLALILIAKRIFHSKLSIPYLLIVSISASALTLPYLWFVFPAYLSGKSFIIFDEILVTIVEALWYKVFLKISLPRSFTISIIANAISFLLGLIIY